MKMAIHKGGPLGIREQVKRQIRGSIEGGSLEPGRALPSARDLAAMLHVNRNTITQAYKELSAEGLLEIVVGSGTFVKPGLVLKPQKALQRVFDQAFAEAGRLGFGQSEISEFFLNRLTALNAAVEARRVLVVDCNDEVVGYLCRLLERELGVQAQGALIQEIEAETGSTRVLFAGKDLVVCGLNHLAELNRAAPDLPVEVVGVLLQVDAKVINTLASLPPGTTVGCVCANRRSTETLYKSAYFSGGRQLKRILAGYDQSAKLRRLVGQCDVIFATNFVHDRMLRWVGPHQRLINVNITIDSSSVELVRERLGRF